MLSGRRFVFGCAMIAVVLLWWSDTPFALPVGLLAGEVFVTIFGLFVFGSFRFQMHKNALTYGMLLIILATFCGLTGSDWHTEINPDRLGGVGRA